MRGAEAFDVVQRNSLSYVHYNYRLLHKYNMSCINTTCLGRITELAR